MDPRLKRLGSDVADAEDEELLTFDAPAQRRRFLAHVARKKAGSAARRFAALAILVGATATFALFVHRSSALHFDVAGLAGEEGEWIAAPGGASVPLAFSDGTRITLAMQARARVVDSTPNGARVVLERGHLAADVVRREGARWRIDAGPFKVHVIGTRFEVSWDPGQERFELLLYEGSVRVVGPTFQQGRTVRSGEKLAVALGAGVPSASPVVAPPPAAIVATPVASLTPVARAPTWQDLAARGVHEQAWSVIESEGFDAIARRARASELAALADVARFSQHPAQAAKALTDLRVRFPTDARAADATFLLGRLAFDQRGAPAEAAKWFSLYLEEQPRGLFAREASGRLIECQQQLGARDAARSAAERYLAVYPDGPHAAIARAALKAAGDR